MKLLLVKTSSLGDIVHTFPALTDAWHQVGGLVCDWVVEEAYADLPTWHPAVRNVIPVALRTWRRAPWVTHVWAARKSIQALRRERYDLVLDAQGLVKSAVLARLARGRRIGPDARGAREPFAARLYQETVALTGARHAIDRNRRLFAGALRYRIPEAMDYGLRLPGSTNPAEPADAEPYLVFVPGTTWPSKRWPTRCWRTLALAATGAGWRVIVLFGSSPERGTARQICEGVEGARVQGPLPVRELARMLARASGTASVDSGPGQLAAAVGAAGVSIYGATDPALTGTRGSRQVHLSADFECSPCLRRRCRFPDRGQVHPDCYATVPPERVWSTLRDLIQARERSL